MVDFRQVVDVAAVPVVVVDQHRKIVFASQKANSIFGALAVDADIHDYFPKGANFKKLIKRAVKNEGGSTTDITTNSPALNEYRVTAKRLPHDKGDVLVAMTFVDRTPMRAAKSMRSDFVANVSHEIRSPLTALSGFIESLQSIDGVDDETRALFLNLMEKEADRMKNLVADLLSLSKVEAKEAQALRKSVDIALLLEQAHEAVLRIAETRGKRLTLDIPSDLPPVLGKFDDLIRVFINLLENAVNYSCEDGAISFTATAVNGDNPLGKPAIRIDVTDQGEGIPKEDIPRLTERFYRVDKSRSRDVGGTGLGLAIVKHVLVRHRGVLEIESTPGVGSTFSVYLPVTA